MLIKKIKFEEASHENELNLIKNIKFEEYFKRFIDETKKCSKAARVYWDYLN